VRTFEQAIRFIRETHTPVLFHVEEVTQPQGHSTSGSHERYKAAERLEWEREWDANRKMREWILSNALASEDEIADIERQSRDHVRTSRQRAWDKYIQPIKDEVNQFLDLATPIAESVTIHSCKKLFRKSGPTGNRNERIF
jgi:TPP-dependent pyruvate/acetoin dehydrogenase alpha subunit